MFKTAIYLSAIYGIYRLLTDKDILTGKTKLESSVDQAKSWAGSAAAMKDEIVSEVKNYKNQPGSPINDTSDTGVFI